MKILNVHEYQLSDLDEAKLASRHICSIKIMDDINSPTLKTDDIVHFIMSEKVNVRDFILYKNYDKYFIRRIVKISKKGVFVAGDFENKLYIISEDKIVARAVGRERKTKYISFTLKPRRKVYSYRKTKITYLKLKNRITDYDEEVNAITLKNLNFNMKKNQTKVKKVKEDLELSEEIKMFINPNDYEIPTEEQEPLNEAEFTVNEADLPSIEDDIKSYEEMGLIDESDTAEESSTEEK